MARPPSRPLTLLVAAATLAYPFAVYFGLGRLPPQSIAGVLLALALVRALAARQAFWWAAAGGAALLAGLSAWGHGWMPLKFYPVLVSGVFLAVFGVSLKNPPSVIERMARLQDPALAPQAMHYCRQVTKVWCLFFVFNGAVAAACALWMSDAAWALYTGVISYVLMGALFAGEWGVRRRVRARIAASEVAHG